MTPAASSSQGGRPADRDGHFRGRRDGRPPAVATWDPDLYLRYAGERQRPFWDLLGRIRTETVNDVVDLGCGPGTTTAALRIRWPGADIVGIDNSDVMISRALIGPGGGNETNPAAGDGSTGRPAAGDGSTGELDPGRDNAGQLDHQPSHAVLVEPDTSSARPALTFINSDIAAWTPEPASLDVILSNAALHWVPGHIDLFATWLAALRPGGALAFQVPGNFSAPSHTLLADLAASDQWRHKLDVVPGLVEVHQPVDYYRALEGLATEVDVWETTYYHPLEGPDPVLEWVRGSALRPYLERLIPEDADAFTDAYRQALRVAYPRDASGGTLFAFRRIFVVASKHY